MLKRQRVLLQLVKQADKAVTRMELIKWCFLLRNETPSGGGSAFYDFVPYQYGPFSFSIYQELDKLVSQSYVKTPDEKTVVLTALGDSVATVPPDVSRDIDAINTRFRGYSTNRLVEYVYTQYPSYTVNSVRKQGAPRPTSELSVFTAGYEKCSVEKFLSLLVASGIRRLIDVRMNPIARRYGFHKSTLSRLCGKLDIDYRHVPELGIHSTERQNLTTKEDYEALFEGYEQTTLRRADAAIESVVKMVKETPSVLVCMESDPCFCHRLRLANVVANRSGLKVVNLKAD